MNKYCFEKYEYGDRGISFLGYITVNGEDEKDAYNLAKEKVGDNIHLQQIYIPQNV